MWGLRKQIAPVLAEGQQTLLAARQDMRTVVELLAFAAGMLIVAVGLLAWVAFRD